TPSWPNSKIGRSSIGCWPSRNTRSQFLITLKRPIGTSPRAESFTGASSARERNDPMTAIFQVWKSLANFAGAIDRLTELAHAVGDAVQARLPSDERPALPSNGQGDGQRIVRSRK